MSRDPAQPAAIRRKVDDWLADDDGQVAIALRTRPVWNADPVWKVGGTTVRVVPCTTPLAVRAAIHDRSDGERLVLLTELNDVDLGDGLLAHLSKCTVRSVSPWDLVRQMFRLKELPPTITDSRFGGGHWIADALTEYAPTQGWPAAPGAVLTREHVLRSLAGELLGLGGDRLDSAGLLQWTTDPHGQLRFIELPARVVDGVTGFLEEVAGPAAVPIMAAVRAGHGVDAIALGLLAGALWSPSRANVADIAAARARLEPFFGGARLAGKQAAAFMEAAEAWLDRTLDSASRAEAQRALDRAEEIAQQIDAGELLIASDVLLSGLTHRLHAFAEAVRLASPLPGQTAAPDLIAAAQRALQPVEVHRAAEAARVETASMAVRALRWLGTADAPAPTTLLEALHRQIREDGWVDRARFDLFAGDVDRVLADAYARLHEAVDARRRRHDQQFANLLAADTAADATPGSMLRVEDVLEKVVAPIVKRRRVLLLVLDGMGVAAATELAESVTRTGTWLELTPEGGPRTGVLAALPTITEVSRCSLLSGRIAVGAQREERAAFAQRFPEGVLLHKADLRASAGAALDPDVVSAVQDAFKPIVAAVINTIDDALDRSDPGTTVWSEETIRAVRDLLALARDRVVVIVSDHGHVIDRGPDAVTFSSPSRENRWRPATPAAVDGEIEIRGQRVAEGDGAVVVPWREDIRYGPRKAGYHGGASAAEAVIPLLVLATDENAVPGWSGAPVASPAWWREAVADVPAPSITPAPSRRRPQRAAGQDTTLFDLPSTEPVESGPTAPARPPLVDALLASELYRQRKDTRAPLPDDRVAAMLSALLANGGRATLETLAAHAGIPAHRINGTIVALRKLLQVEGYPVLSADPDGQTIILDADLLALQFHLGKP
ncbi:BREX-2 system phosphatase PglZ [Hamadaea sp. NPDC051192]|uniref:BREX-2 system phosphatase PglZ n=1 Tax=Hamadaea sp. NPDC051192 TaxID=3154940 RepID=UPI003416872C